MKKILAIFLFLFACFVGFSIWNHKPTQNLEVKEVEQDTIFVMGPEGKWVKYAFFEENPDYDPNEDYSDATKNYYESEIKGKYCYSHYAPHGALWQIHCFDDEKLCQQNLDADLKDFMILDAKKCSRPYLTEAWCISSIKTGLYRYYDGDTYGEMLTGVCAKNKSQCEQVAQYRFDKKSICHKETVLSNKNEFNYLTSEQEIKKIIKQNRESKPLVFKK